MAALFVATVCLLMIGEALLSARREAALRAWGAVEPPGDVFPVMRLAYPACFLSMAAEHLVRHGTSADLVPAGVLVFVLAKALKYWAIAALGTRWSFRVLVIPGAPLVTTGPYRYLRHPNYVGVAGELAGAALALAAPLTGAIGIVAFGEILRRRIRVEDRALWREVGSAGRD